jgi:hypothetical protein
MEVLQDGDRIQAVQCRLFLRVNAGFPKVYQEPHPPSDPLCTGVCRNLMIFSGESSKGFVQGAKNEKGTAMPSRFQSLFGGAREDRTPDLLNAIQALSHLSYDPTGEKHRGVAVAMPGI